MKCYTSNFKREAITTYIKKTENLNLTNLEKKVKDLGKEKQRKLKISRQRE